MLFLRSETAFSYQWTAALRIPTISRNYIGTKISFTADHPGSIKMNSSQAGGTNPGYLIFAICINDELVASASNYGMSDTDVHTFDSGDVITLYYGGTSSSNATILGGYTLVY